MSFELKERIISTDPSLIDGMIDDLTSKYGEPLPDGKEVIITIGAHWDDGEKTRIRAASFHKGTIAGMELSDGNVAFRCLWQTDLASAFDRGEISHAQELTEEQFNNLLPVALE